MKKLFALMLTIFVFGSTASAQNSDKRAVAKGVKKVANAVADAATDNDGPWKKGGEGILNASHTALSQWAEGGTSTTSLIANLSLFADYAKGKSIWENDARFVLGFNRTKTDGFNKADDVIDIDSKYGYKLSKKAYWSTLFTFDSQMLVGETTSTAYTTALDTINGGCLACAETTTVLGKSRFLSPAAITLGTGIDYKPQDWISIYFSPLTFKGLIVADDYIAGLGIHGQAPGDKFKPELGARLTLGVKRDIIKNVSVSSTLDLYSNFLENAFGEVKPGNIDVLWVTNFGFKINKFLAATLEYTLKYDDEVFVPKEADNGEIYLSKGIQSKTFFGIGLTYKFAL